ncbi:MAG: hypothetical protein ABIR26_02315 [Ramlibacter sp.]
MDVHTKITNPLPNLAQQGIGDAKPLHHRRAGSDDGISLSGKTVEFKRPQYAAKFSLAKFLFGGQSYNEQKATFQAERAAKHRDLLFLELAKDNPDRKVVMKHSSKLLGLVKGANVNFRMGTQQDGTVSPERAKVAAKVLNGIGKFEKDAFSGHSMLEKLRDGLAGQADELMDDLLATAMPDVELAKIKILLADEGPDDVGLDELLDQLETGLEDHAKATGKAAIAAEARARSADDDELVHPRIEPNAKSPSRRADLSRQQVLGKLKNDTKS